MPLLGPNIPALVQKRDVMGLIKLLQRDNPRVRREAIRALGDLRDPAAIPALTEIFTQRHSRISEQIETVKALEKFADEAAIDALLKANAASMARERADIEQATTQQDNPYRPGFYINRISANEYTLRSEIAQALGQIGSERALAGLFDMLGGESGWMESTARDAISQVIARTLKGNDESHARILLERLAHGSQPERHMAANCLRQFRGAPVVKALMDVAGNDKEQFAVREVALGSLGKLADETILEELDELAQSGNRAVARLAAHAAMEIRERRESSNEQT